MHNDRSKVDAEALEALVPGAVIQMNDIAEEKEPLKESVKIRESSQAKAPRDGLGRK